MNNRPVHENLDTSFVNLSALVRYLRRRQFIGCVRVELNSYEAEIVLEEGNKIKVREHDKVSGRIAEGEEALQRLLIRSRDPGGTIHVYQTVVSAELPKIEFEEKSTVIEPKIVEKEIVTEIPVVSAPPIKKPVAPIVQPVQNVANSAVKSFPVANVSPVIATKQNRPKFPFELKNSVEDKAKNSQINQQEWELLLNLTNELLGTIDQSLSLAKLDFKAAFSKSLLEISPDYPFLNPASKVFNYGNGKISMQSQVAPKLFSAGINEALRRILEKLSANPKFAEVYRHTVQKIIALIHHRKSYYDKFFITPQLQRIVGV